MDIIRPGLVGNEVAADARRYEYDGKNERLIVSGQQVDLAFIGDSITQEWPVEKYFNHDDIFAVNRGIGGDIPLHICHRFEADAVQLKPRYILLMAGINEVWQLGEVNSTDTPEASIGRIMPPMIEMIHFAVERKVDIVVGSIVPLNTVAVEADKIRNRVVVECNRQLKEICAQNGLIYADYHTAMVDSDGFTLREGLANDGVHPNAKGYDIMARVLADSLKDKFVLSVCYSDENGR